MSNIILSFEVVFPLLTYMAIGYFLKQRKFFSDITLSEMNSIVYKIFIPATLFVSIINSKVDVEFDIRVLLYAFISVLALFVILCFIIPRVFHDKKDASVIIQGMYRSNFVLFGTAITASICGADKLGMSAIATTIIVPTFNILAVVLFEMFRGGNINYKNVLKGVITNPLIDASILGLVFLLMKISIPNFIYVPLKSLSSIATPLALIVLGGTFKFSGLMQYRKQLIIATAGRLVFVPLVFVTLAIFMGIRGSNLVCLMVLFASPAAVSSYPMAEKMGGNGELAGYIVVTTSTLAIISIFIWTYVLSSFCLI